MDKCIQFDFVNGKSLGLVVSDKQYFDIISWIQSSGNLKFYDIKQENITYVINKDNICLITANDAV